MQITGLTLDDFTLAVKCASEAYEENLVVHRDSKDLNGMPAPRIRVRVGVLSSRGAGAARSWSGRRIPSACWHAHRDVFREAFKINPDAVVRTRLAVYRGSAGFEETYPETASVNVGSMVQPAYMDELCECGGWA